MTSPKECKRCHLFIVLGHGKIGFGIRPSALRFEDVTSKPCEKSEYKEVSSFYCAWSWSRLRDLHLLRFAAKMSPRNLAKRANIRRCHLFTVLGHGKIGFGIRPSALRFEDVTSKPCLMTLGNRNEMNKYLAELHADECYHVYNRTNNKELLFKDDEDRKLFLTKYAEYLLPYVETLVYCLLGNHFHFMVKVKSIEQIIKAVEEEKEQNRTVPQRRLLDAELDCRSAHIVLKSQFTRLFTSYAMRFNKKYKREGNLFNRPFKRVKVEKENHYSYLIYYIHANTKRHGIKSDFKNYKWNSYRAMLTSKATNVNREVVIDWFGGKSAFVEFHNQLDVTLSEIDYLIIED